MVIEFGACYQEVSGLKTFKNAIGLSFALSEVSGVQVSRLCPGILSSTPSPPESDGKYVREFRSSQCPEVRQVREEVIF